MQTVPRVETWRCLDAPSPFSPSAVALLAACFPQDRAALASKTQPWLRAYEILGSKVMAKAVPHRGWLKVCTEKSEPPVRHCAYTKGGKWGRARVFRVRHEKLQDCAVSQTGAGTNQKYSPETSSLGTPAPIFLHKKTKSISRPCQCTACFETQMPACTVALPECMLCLHVAHACILSRGVLLRCLLLR